MVPHERKILLVARAIEVVEREIQNGNFKLQRERAEATAARAKMRRITSSSSIASCPASARRMMTVAEVWYAGDNDTTPEGGHRTVIAVGIGRRRSLGLQN